MADKDIEEFIKKLKAAKEGVTRQGEAWGALDLIESLAKIVATNMQRQVEANKIIATAFEKIGAGK